MAHCRNSRNGPDGAANIIFRKDVENRHPIETRKEKIEEYRNKLIRMLLYPEAILMIIEPEATRPRLISALEILKERIGPQETW